jgi:carboxymethylenebutenolidase
MRLTRFLLCLSLALVTSTIALADDHRPGDVMMRAISGEGGEPAGRDVAYDPDNDATRGYLAMPEGEGPFPAVILIHEWNGLVDRIRQTADAFAEHGYIALAADLYEGRTGSSREENIALVREARSDEQAIIDNLDAAVDWLEYNTPTTGRIATIGWCFGGGVALSYALGGEQHEGTAIFYGSLIDDPERMAGIHHEVYGTFAAEDNGIPPEEVDAFVGAMREAGIDNDVHIYDAVDHGFWLYTERDPANNRPAAAHAWERLRAYLDRTIGDESEHAEAP